LNRLVIRENAAGTDLFFGIIADCQYHKSGGTDTRKYALSADKLQRCVRHFNQMKPDFVIQLGDLIDRDFESFNPVLSVYERLHMPRYHVLGNHDYDVQDRLKREVPRKLGLSRPYYDFSCSGWRLVVLDGNDISFHAYPAGSDSYKKAAAYYEGRRIDSPTWNGAVGFSQLRWLRSVLKNASDNGEPVILFNHYPVFPEDRHNLWNAPEVNALMEKYSNIRCYFAGHNHHGLYGMHHGIHFLTLNGMVETETTAYAVCRIFNDRIEIEGYGREPDRVLRFRGFS
jgi:manganese-dependent ADP-ribose/CDP-alcohol diphosphatase